MTKDPSGLGSLMTNFLRVGGARQKSPSNPSVFHWMPYEFLWITETKLLKHSGGEGKCLRSGTFNHKDTGREM